ncbi:MAG: hypothetical protein HQ568_07545 [Calditrichaeota bacterium]|nr:hypothetical protein [Calditrichota bacterium]
MKKTLLFVVVLLLVGLLAGTSQALEIFFWQHDNGLRISDRVLRASLTSTQSLTRTLDELDLDYDINVTLPSDLSDYDLVMTSLSFFCPG